MVDDFPRSHLPEDLTPLFNWNTKQLFLYLEAEYENAQGVSLTTVSLPKPSFDIWSSELFSTLASIPSEATTYLFSASCLLFYS
jgi:hypothetical protein